MLVAPTAVPNLGKIHRHRASAKMDKNIFHVHVYPLLGNSSVCQIVTPQIFTLDGQTIIHQSSHITPNPHFMGNNRHFKPLGIQISILGACAKPG